MGEKRAALREAEQAVLGALLLDPSRLTVVAEHLKPEDFTTDDRHRAVFDAITELDAAGTAIDEVTVTSVLQDTGRADKELAMYVTHLVGRTPTAANVETYARFVSQRAGVRRLYVASRDAMRKLTEGEDGDVVISELEQTIGQVRRRTPRRFNDGHEVARQYIAAAMARENGNTNGEVFVPTGLTGIDNAIGGLSEGLYVIGARPGVGKTALMVAMADNMANAGHRVAVFSAEMTEAQIIRRALARRARVRYRQLQTGGLDGHEWAKLMRVRESFPRERFWIDDDDGINTAQLFARAERQHEKEPLAAIFVDYLQLIAPEGTKAVNREQQVAACAKQLKAISKRLRIPVVALAQLNQNSKNPADRTTDRDFRESDTIYATGDVVMAIKRPIVWQADADPLEAKIEIIKNREGECADVRLDYEGWCVNFIDHDPAREQPRSLASSIPRPPDLPPTAWGDE